MSQTAVSTDHVTRSLSAYADSREHLFDEIRRLGLLLRLRLQRHRIDRQAGPLEQFKGLVIAEAEIADLLLEMEAHDSDVLSSAACTSDAQVLRQSLTDLTAEIESRREASADAGVYLSLPALSRIFRLNRLEEQTLLTCLAPELDQRYEKLYAFIQDDVTRKRPTVDLIFWMTCVNAAARIHARLAFDANAPLVRRHLLTLGDEHDSLLSRSLKLDERILDFLLDISRLDAKLAGAARVTTPNDPVHKVRIDEGRRERLAAFARSVLCEPDDGKGSVLFYLRGASGSARRATAQAVCRDLGVNLVTVDLERIIEGPLASGEAASRLGREAALRSAALCIENFQSVLADEKYRSYVKDVLNAITHYTRLAFVLGDEPWRPPIEMPDHHFIEQVFTIPAGNVRKTLWKEELAGVGSEISDFDLGLLASNFQFAAGQMRDAIIEAQTLARWRAGESARIILSDLQTACRSRSSVKLNSLARKIEPRYDWQDIVLPADQAAQLREICVQARRRDIVYGEWGFQRKLSLGRGLNVLFSGPAGTGKTMAAEVIARDLGLDLYKVDLSQIVSKYIGETEKNLHKIFLEAQSSYGILFFDEADALFGRRSEVKDAHDRYANIEIGYLLQKMEEYDGMSILATNLRQNMDEAFIRRLQVIVDFPFPNERYRELIWSVIFPTESPLSKDVDFNLLAREVKLAGGNIKNIALAAAFFAADNGGLIRMPHLVRAAKREYQKVGRVWADAPWNEAASVRP